MENFIKCETFFVASYLLQYVLPQGKNIKFDMNVNI